MARNKHCYIYVLNLDRPLSQIKYTQMGYVNNLSGDRQINCQPKIFFVIRTFPDPIVLQTIEYKAQLYCIRTIPIGPIYKSESRDLLFRNAQAKHKLIFQSHMVHLCILYPWPLSRTGPLAPNQYIQALLFNLGIVYPIPGGFGSCPRRPGIPLYFECFFLFFCFFMLGAITFTCH